MEEINKILDRTPRKNPFNPLEDPFDLFPFSKNRKEEEDGDKKKYFSNGRFGMS